MTKILENKWVVAGLIVAAVGALGWNFRTSLPGMDLIANARETSPEEVAAGAAAEDPQAIPSLTLSTNRLRMNADLNQWRQTASESEIKRDPFSFPVKELAPDGTPAPEGTAPPSVTLQAISMRGQSGLAVINRQVVAAGDTISGYEVISISAAEVVVNGYGERKSLRLDFALPAPIPDESGTPAPDPKP